MEQEEYRKSILEYEGIRDAIECAREDAAKENFEQGLKQGRAEGEVRAKLAMAKSMLEKKIDIDLIISITGLTAEEIMEN